MPAEVVRALLRAGASTKAKACGGATPTMMAVMMNGEGNVRALIEGSYDVSGELALAVSDVRTARPPRTRCGPAATRSPARRP